MADRGRPKVLLELTDTEREMLTRWSRRPRSAQALALRCRIVLECAGGSSNKDVAARLGIAVATVGKWRGRFVNSRLDGLTDEPRPGAPRTVSDDAVEAVIVRTLESTPKDATHWSTRSMAQSSGLSQSTVSRIWRTFGLQPHRAETFKLPADLLFVGKVRDVVGLYLDPPERALVLCVDEKSQIQALDRTAPIFPMRPGLPERRTSDYVRHGTTTLFAALGVASGNVIGSMHAKHRAIEFKKFLVKLDTEVPPDLQVHLILDNYATHKTAAIKRWLVGHPRFHLHLTPTSSSWLNLVERWFGELTQKKITPSTVERQRDTAQRQRAGKTVSERDDSVVALHRRNPGIQPMIPGDLTVTGYGSNPVVKHTRPRRPDSGRSSVMPSALNRFGPMVTSKRSIAAWKSAAS